MFSGYLLSERQSFPHCSRCRLSGAATPRHVTHARPFGPQSCASSGVGLDRAGAEPPGRVRRRTATSPSYQTKPFFKNAQLNRCIILKHRLRRNELDLFPTYRTTATKIIVPIDESDLKLGGRFLFVDQIGYDNVLAGAFGEGSAAIRVDRRVLELLDQLPSLDPFLLREQLRRIGVNPRPAISTSRPATCSACSRSSKTKSSTLVQLCFGGEVASATSAARLVRKILSTQVDTETEPLRLTLQPRAGGISGRRVLLEGIPLLQVDARHADGRRRRRDGRDRNGARARWRERRDARLIIEKMRAAVRRGLFDLMRDDAAPCSQILRRRLCAPGQRQAAELPRLPARRAAHVQPAGRASGRDPAHRQLLAVPLPQGLARRNSRSRNWRKSSRISSKASPFPKAASRTPPRPCAPPAERPPLSPPSAL